MKICCFFGVELRINRCFLVVLLAYGVMGYFTEALVVYGAAMLHEIAHAIAAASCGWTVVAVEILPFGGVAQIMDSDLLTCDSRTEALVALAGPFQNIIMALAGVVLFHCRLWDTILTRLFVQANLGMALFNLLPGFPLDGGRILAAYLKRWIPWSKATAVSCNLGWAIGVALAAYGLLSLESSLFFINTIVLGGFVATQASHERRWARLMFWHLLARRRHRLEAGYAAVARILIVDVDTPLGFIFDQFVVERYHIIGVLDKEHSLLAIITEHELIAGLFALGPAALFSDLLHQATGVILP